ncbi:MAG: diguanylate cyclase [Candidatus Izemoplasmatales bacterium]|nr:diguanylate cyclase [Candidatus Izemoplasmatales bacterium]
MRFDFLLASLLFSIASFMIFAAVFIFTRREMLIGLKLLGVFSIVNVLFLFGEASMILSDSEFGILVFSHIEFIGRLFIPTIWFMMSFQQKEKRRRFSTRTMLLLVHIPTVALIANMLYPWQALDTPLTWIQTLYFHSHEIVTNSVFGPGFTGVVYEKGPLYYILMGYNLLLLVMAVYNYAKTSQRTLRSRRKNPLTMMLASMFLCVMAIVNLVMPKTFLVDPAPIATSMFAIVTFFALYKYELFDLTPLAYRRVFEEASFPVFILDRKYFVISMNNFAEKTFDFTQRNTLMSLHDFHSQDPTFVEDLIENGTREVSIQNQNETIYFQAKIEELTRNHRFLGYLITYQDITNHILEMKKMEIMATFDDLTRIYNRRVFYVKAIEYFDDAVIHKTPISFIMFDLDDFKEINDIYGHLAGDRVLREVCEKILKTIDQRYVFARFGGEEFIMFIKGVTPLDAYEIADQLRQLVEKMMIVHENHKIRVTASFGVSGTDAQITKSFEQFIKDADEALYESKNSGKNRVQLKD